MADTIIRQALDDSRVKSLYDKVASQISLRFESSGDQNWGASVEAAEATITYGPAIVPGAALAHELFHIDLQLQGYQRPRSFISTTASPPVFKALMDALDNELQHRRFYDRYLELGFEPQFFYADDDVQASAEFREFLELADQTRIARSLVYLGVSAPGGAMSADEQRALRLACDVVDDGAHAHSWATLDDCFKRWKTASTIDSRPYLKEILLALAPDTVQKPHLTWYTFSRDPASTIFPKGGEFVGPEFDWKPA